MTLTAATFLGANTNVVLERLGDRLEADLGVTVEICSTDGGWSSDDAEDGAAQVDVLWMCGRLLVGMQHQGRLACTTVAAPVFAGENAAVYRSVVVAQTDDGPSSLDEALAGVVAVNEPQSWSGHHALRRHLASIGSGSDRWFGREVLTGSHVASIAAVATGEADCASIDHTIWRSLQRVDPLLVSGLRVIDSTQDWPAPPIALAPRLNHNEQIAITQSILGATNLPGVVVFVPAARSTYELMIG